MALLQSMERQGNFLFKYRGQFPVILFILAVPFIYLTDYNSISEQGKTCFLYTNISITIKNIRF